MAIKYDNERGLRETSGIQLAIMNTEERRAENARDRAFNKAAQLGAKRALATMELQNGIILTFKAPDGNISMTEVVDFMGADENGNALIRSGKEIYSLNALAFMQARITK